MHIRPTFHRSSRRRSVLVFNFFGSILKRGIPHYVDSLCVALEQEGIEARQLQCPKVLRKLPRTILNCLFVITEQVIVPLAGMRYDRVIYPSNSVSVVGMLSKRTAVILHDFISSRGRNKSVAACYTRITQIAYERTKGDVIYISHSTQRIGQSLRRFPRSRTLLFPNSFYRFMQLVSAEPPLRGDAVLLCSGWSRNKDLSGALQMYLESGLYETRALRILGMAGRRDVVDRFERDHPEVTGRVELMPEVDDQQVVWAYEQAAWTWVHSLSEGYGRSIAEARICGSRVVASNIPPFREQSDEAIFFYRGLDEFKKTVLLCEAVEGQTSRRIPEEHNILKAEIVRFMSHNE